LRAVSRMDLVLDPAFNRGVWDTHVSNSDSLCLAASVVTSLTLPW
jgi:hypothetical protein